MTLRYLLLITLLLLSQLAGATTYYVKNSGSDSAAGTSDATAWKTISKVNSFVFSPGDDVYLLDGDTWQEQLIIDWSGTSGDRVVVGTYYMNGGTETPG